MSGFETAAAKVDDITLTGSAISSGDGRAVSMMRRQCWGAGSGGSSRPGLAAPAPVAQDRDEQEEDLWDDEDDW